MKKLFIVICLATVFAACTEAGEGSEVNKDSTGTNKDTMTQVGTGGSATSKDTASYDRMPATNNGDTTSQH